MYIESIEQESMTETGALLTRVALSGVGGHCILTRVLIQALGKPGTERYGIYGG